MTGCIRVSYTLTNLGLAAGAAEVEVNALVVFSTTSSEEEAARIARDLVEKRLAACVQVISPVTSFYRWSDPGGEGEVQKSDESLLLIKTGKDRLDELIAAIESAHSYDVPEIVAVEVTGGASKYLQWLQQETAGADADNGES